ncbi:hypothetical protein CEP53_008961 [Fusarium sp. AF-6]|nr:hypothetical protein CEP53_008961 [Fusarium sp. AF-6]
MQPAPRPTISEQRAATSSNTSTHVVLHWLLLLHSCFSGRHDGPRSTEPWELRRTGLGRPLAGPCILYLHLP